MVIKFKYKELLAILTEVATVIDDSLANEDMKNIIFEIKNGVLNTSTTLCKYNNTWFVVSGGKVAWGYTGNMKYNGGTFKVVNGIVRF